jgi:hypothetical protein
MKTIKVVRTYTLTLPDLGTEEWAELQDAFVADAKQWHADDPSISDLTDEDFEPNVMLGNVSAWLTLECDAGNYTDIVQIEDVEVDPHDPKLQTLLKEFQQYA